MDFARWAGGERITAIRRRMRFCTRFGSSADHDLKSRGFSHHFLCDFGKSPGLLTTVEISYEISLNRDRFLCYFLTVQ